MADIIETLDAKNVRFKDMGDGTYALALPAVTGGGVVALTLRGYNV